MTRRRLTLGSGVFAILMASGCATSSLSSRAVPPTTSGSTTDLQLGWVILYVPDVKATTRFYETAFGLRARFVDPKGTYAELETGATILAVSAEALAPNVEGIRVHANQASDPTATAEIALVTTDPARAFQRAVANGAQVLLAPELKPWGQTVGYVRDINGVLIEICSPVPPIKNSGQK